MPIHHLGIDVGDIEEGKLFYLAALAPLGYKELHNYPGFAVGLGVSASVSDFWLSGGKSQNRPLSQGVHLAFKAESREVVDQFYEAAMYVQFSIRVTRSRITDRGTHCFLEKRGGKTTVRQE